MAEEDGRNRASRLGSGCWKLDWACCRRSRPNACSNGYTLRPSPHGPACRLAASITTSAGADGFIGSLLEHALAKDRNPPFAQAVAAFEEQLTAGATFLDALIVSSTRMMKWQETNPTFWLQMAVWAKSHRDVAMARRLDRMHRLVEDETMTYYDAIVQLLGREMRPPYELRDLASTFIALFEGLSVRRAVSPTAVPAERFGNLLVAVITMMTRMVGDGEETGAWLEGNAPRWAG